MIWAGDTRIHFNITYHHQHKNRKGIVIFFPFTFSGLWPVATLYNPTHHKKQIFAANRLKYSYIVTSSIVSDILMTLNSTWSLPLGL